MYTLVALYFGAAYAPLAPAHVHAAVLQGHSVEHLQQVLGAATQFMITGAVCGSRLKPKLKSHKSLTPITRAWQGS